jgi:hypothetical protein
MSFFDSELLEKRILQKFVIADGQDVGPLQSFCPQRTKVGKLEKQYGATRASKP